jgi:hypothetical protein
MNFKRFMKWQYIIPTLILVGPIIIAIFVFVTGGIVMLLWNWLLPRLFGFPEITLLQGFGLLALCRILFGGFGGGSGGRGDHSKHMTPEERERFRERMRDRYCSTRPDDQEGVVIDSSSANPKNSA